MRPVRKVLWSLVCSWCVVPAHHAVTEVGGWLRLAALTDVVKHTVQMTGGDTLVGCRESPRQALGS